MNTQPATLNSQLLTRNSQLDTDAAFAARGAKAAVFKPRFGQAHQQYFTPKWVCEANLLIAEALFDVQHIEGRIGKQLRVFDPTCGTGRLLAPFAEAGHHVFGIELDARQASTARRAVGKHNIRHGDICAYAPLIPPNSFDVATINPPYGLWWPTDDHLKSYELCPQSSAEYKGSIESQNMVLELVTNSLFNYYYDGGLLLGVFSGRFFDTNPRALEYVKRNYQIIALLTLPRLFEPEYDIKVNATYLAAYRVSPSTPKLSNYLTASIDEATPQALACVVDAFKSVNPNHHYKRQYESVSYLTYRHASPPSIVDLKMTVQVDTSATTLNLAPKGVRPSDDWATAWLRFYTQTPLETYDQAQGTNAPIAEAVSSLPNILRAGADRSLAALTSLGFDVQASEETKKRLAQAAKRYERDRLPLRELTPMEYLAWYEDGPITAKEDSTLLNISKDSVYNLQVRWERSNEQAGEDESKGKGKNACIQRTYIDRGYLTFHFIGPVGEEFKVREVDADRIKAMVDTFGLPEVKTFQDLPKCEIKSWTLQLHRLVENHAQRNGGLRPTDIQFQDIVAMATKSHVANLYEMGGGKTMTIAFWAELRKYKRVLIVTPASVVPGIIEDLQKWGFDVWPEALNHKTVSDIRQHKNETPLEKRHTKFYITSYEAMGLEDGVYDAWSHDVYDREGNLIDTHDHNHGAKCDAIGCRVRRGQIVKKCPKCGATGKAFHSGRGSNNGGPRACRKCGAIFWTAGTLTPATENADAVKGRCMAPLGRRIKRLFSCVILDEVQDAKSKGSLKGETTRALKARGKAILSGTWLKGYVTDLFWSAGWLNGFGSPLWPFSYSGGAPKFLEQFGTYQFITKEFAATLQIGKRKLIPSVSNLGRLWRLLSPFTIRRLKEDFLKDLPPKHPKVHWVPLTPEHARIYRRAEEAMRDVIEREMRKDDANVNMGAISMALWWGRYAASVPTRQGALHYAGAFGLKWNPETTSAAYEQEILDKMFAERLFLTNIRFNKVLKAMELIQEIRDAGEKVIVFTSLRGLYDVMYQTLKKNYVGVVGMDGVPTKKRNDVARQWEQSPNTVLLAGTGTLNRGVTINGANHIIILNTEWSPETTLQAEDRCHRPGQTKDVYVHYILSADTIDAQMWDLLNQKAAAQRAVFDKEALFKTVEDVMAEAANAQLAVAKAIVEVQRPPAAIPLSIPQGAGRDAQLPNRNPEQGRELPKHVAPHNPQPATQLTLADLIALNPEITPKHKRKKTPVPEQQTSFLDLLTATA